VHVWLLPLLLLLQSRAVQRFDRLLLKVPEHTWGLDVKTTLEHFDCCGTYDNAHLHACMAGKEPQPLAAAQPALSELAATPAGRAADTTVAAGVAGVAGVSVGGVDPPGCGGMTRLTTSWQRQAAYVDWALQVGPS
jgi:hypothetical protein